MLFTLNTTNTWANQINLNPKKPISVRDQEEQFVNCFEQNMICHETVKRMAKADNELSWESLMLSFVTGVIAGLYVAKSR